MSDGSLTGQLRFCLSRNDGAAEVVRRRPAPDRRQRPWQAYKEPTRCRRARAVARASSTLATTCPARAWEAASGAFASSSSAFTSTTPSRLFNLWNSTSADSGSDVPVGTLVRSGCGAAWVIETPEETESRRRRGLHFGAAVQAIRLRVRLAPQRVGEDPHGSTGRSHVFDLAAVDPVVNRPAAHADVLARLQDRQSLAISNHGPHPSNYDRNSPTVVHTIGTDRLQLQR